MTDAERLRHAVRGHLDAIWPDRTQEEFAWTLGPIEQRLPGFRVRRIEPQAPADPWLYSTVGASAALSDAGRKEFILLSPSESPAHVETLTMVANFNADPRYRLTVGTTINIGRPWIDGASADHLLVSLPYPFGPTLEHCETPVGHVQVLWLVPITATEARYIRERGMDEFEDRLEGSGVNVIAPNRRAVI